MASSKDTFEPAHFLTNSFAAGMFRGVGVAAPAAWRVVCRDVYVPGQGEVQEVHTPGDCVDVYIPGAEGRQSIR